MNNLDALSSSLHAPNASAPIAPRLRSSPDRAATTEISTSPRSADRVEISPSAMGSSQRAGELARIRAEIDSGAYLTDERIDGAISALIDHLRAS